VVVVDNGSTDGSLAAAVAVSPGTAVVDPGENLGYGAAVNRGAAATSSALVLVCNPDLEVPAGAVEALAAVLDADPGLALVGPLIRTPSGERYPSARRFPSMVDAAGHGLLGIFAPDNRFTRNYQRTELDVAGDGALDVDWVSGACFLVRREAFEQVGGFDESFFMYLEDVDLCWRLGRAGWRVAYAPAASVVHLQGRSTDRHPYRMILEHHRSLLRFATRSSVGWRRALLPLVAVGIAVRCGLASLARALER
jgi:N-acetylglucosaminyl-diphospho-decaprenol L-rhamnosyltransferase